MENKKVSFNIPGTHSQIVLEVCNIFEQESAIGIGVYDSEFKTFRLLSGSKIIGSPLNSFNRKDTYKDVTENHCSFIGGLYILEKVYIFASPSSASSVVLGRSSNGWKDWKDDFGKCLNDIYRKQ